MVIYIEIEEFNLKKHLNPELNETFVYFIKTKNSLKWFKSNYNINIQKIQIEFDYSIYQELSNIIFPKNLTKLNLYITIIFKL
jgi:macrodomain Ter protein organizer (MatP/YcbG family)